MVCWFRFLPLSTLMMLGFEIRLDIYVLILIVAF